MQMSIWMFPLITNDDMLDEDMHIASFTAGD